ncbi:substrate-binding domain-containing protein [Amycolatopsis alkalitolerans]|uniref:Sugar ABC transporter substrate-binding protein n=1 Tax=Amycolatopsis alkalitolerans TaxID=2547244 RepID=A0A5C4M3N2_9PSEU|nr:substrate-binding domain-containing protein [Amycolatopsis alkalitolerans]TNC26996.1 sugar ABC transporter substrate-binding protein [Amycolatopsis alkalitolerans]
MNSRKRLIAFAATLMAAALAVAGCSSSGGKQAEQQNAAASAGTATAGTANTPRMKIAMITHETPGDTFWDIVQKGARAAAAKDNVDLVYSSDPAGPNQANLMQNAIDQKVDGIAVTLAHPDAMAGVVAKAKAAGIPVVGFNSGIDNWASQGLLGYFGSDETLAGQDFGERLNQVGAKHALCVLQEQGQVALEARCAGVKQTFKGQTEDLYVNGQDSTATQSTIQAKLQQDRGIDYVVTLGAPVALLAVKSVTGAGSSAKVATFDTNKALVQAIKDGTVQWAVDQQPYLQGYLAVDSLWLYKVNGDTLGGGKATLTGPAFITKDNIDSVAKFAEAGTR